MKKTLLIFTTAIASFSFAQDVNIPDANFKAFLVAQIGINTNADTEIQVSEAQAFSGSMNCSNLNIADMTGLEEFINLSTLNCDDNQLTSLDVSQNTQLDWLWCKNNQITSLDVSSNTLIENFDCRNNQITSLDVSNITALQELRCSQNGLTTLTTGSVPVTEIYCGLNQLSSLDVSSNTSLTRLGCYSNPLLSNLVLTQSLEHLSFGIDDLSSIDLSPCTSLNYLECYTTSLTNLDMSANADLQYFYIGDTQFTDLDLSNNTMLEEIEINLTDLTSLNLANGNNTAITYIDLTGNPSLTCIEVDDAVYSTANWIDVDNGASFDENCCGLNTTILVNGATLSAQLTTMAYQWLDCDNGNQPIPGETNQSFTPTANGNYACIVDNLICQSTSDCIEVTTVGLNENELTMIEIYPNPATDMIQINSTSQFIQASVFTLSGRMVLQSEQSTLDISNLDAGVYIVSTKTENGMATSRFIKK